MLQFVGIYFLWEFCSNNSERRNTSFVTRHIRYMKHKIFCHFQDIVCEAELHNDEKIRRILCLCHVYATWQKIYFVMVTTWESYFSRIFFTVTDLEKFNCGWNICGERKKNISYVTKNIFSHGNDLRESCYT